MHNPVIVIPCFKKVHALKRLLSSLLDASYPDDVKIVFSVDGGGDPDVMRCVERLEWPFGEKEIITHDENIGLRRNILECGDLSEKYGSVIVLEDDSYVARDFYDYAIRSRDFYAGDDRIAGISLYAYEYSEINQGRFCPLQDGNDTYFMQWASSRGQLWTAEHWESFCDWYEKNKGSDLSNFNIPQTVIRWRETSWKKYYIAYLVDTDRFFVYPHVSFVSNCGDVGTHCGKGQSKNGDFVVTQVTLPLSCNVEGMKFSEFPMSQVRYDSFFEIFPKILLSNPTLSEYSFDVDLTGSKEHGDFTKKYALSSKTCKTPIASFSNVLMPLAMNVINNCDGDYLTLGEVDDFEGKDDCLTRIYKSFVNREILTDRRGLDLVIARGLKKIGWIR